MIIQNEAGEDIEVYTAEERNAAIAEARAVVEGEYKPKLEEATVKLTEAQRRAAERAEQFGNLRKLSEDQVNALSEKDRIIYENQVRIDKQEADRTARETLLHESSIDALIRTKVGNDLKLFEEAKKMYTIVSLEDKTPEQMAQRVNAAIGALGQIQPDLLAAAGIGFNGSFEPQRNTTEDEKTFADTPAGSALAEKLGLKI